MKVEKLHFTAVITVMMLASTNRSNGITVMTSHLTECNLSAFSQFSDLIWMCSNQVKLKLFFSPEEFLGA